MPEEACEPRERKYMDKRPEHDYACADRQLRIETVAPDQHISMNFAEFAKAHANYDNMRNQREPKQSQADAKAEPEADKSTQKDAPEPSGGERRAPGARAPRAKRPHAFRCE
eukprot:3329718-Pyramimonas_sp.AAC.1